MRHPSSRHGELQQLHDAVKVADVTGALAAFERCVASEVLGQPSRPLYNRLLALLVDRPADIARVRESMKHSNVAPDETTVCTSSARLSHSLLVLHRR